MEQRRAYTHEDLEKARQQIKRAEHLIEIQQRIVERLIEVGASTKPADRLISKMREGLAARHRHLGDIEAELAGGSKSQY